MTGAIWININTKTVYKKPRYSAKQKFAQYLMASSKTEEVRKLIFIPKYI